MASHLTPPNPTPKIEGFESRFLDVLRAVAVFGVVTVHTTQWVFSGIEVLGGILVPVYSILGAGRYGVPVFFFLSGYLLSTIYGQHNQSLTFRKFAFSRLGRIWPLWMLFSLVWSAFFLIIGEKSDWVFSGFLLSMLFLLWVSPAHYDSFIGGAWSIQIEIVLYALFFFLRKLSWPLILMLAVAINIGGIALSFSEIDGTGFVSAMRRLSLQSGINFFVVGVLSARFLSRKESQIGSAVKFEIPKLGTGFGFGNTALTALWLATFLFAPYFGGSPIEALGFLFLSLFVAFVLSSNDQIGSAISWFGRRSYFVFFMHFLVLAMLPSSPFETNVSALLAVPVAIASVIIISYAPSELCYRYFEAPLRERFKKF